MLRHFRFFVKSTRAYTLTLEKDLLGEWIVRRTWGPQQKPYSQKRIEVFDSEKEALRRFEALSVYRIKKRKYKHSNK